MHPSTLPPLILLSLLLCSSCTGDTPEERPNIIVILTDDQSPFAYNNRDYHAGDKPQEQESWACYGAPVLSPHIDRLAEQGMLFTNANVSTTVCTPSRYTTLTGRYGSRTPAERFNRMFPPGTLHRIENVVELGEGEQNVAKILQANGYRTGFVGKSHLIKQEIVINRNKWEEAGLKTYDIEADPSDPEVAAALEHNNRVWESWMQEYGFDYVGAFYKANLREVFNRKLNVHNVEYTTKAALEFIESSSDEPFFLYFSPTMPHDPNAWEKDEDGKYQYALDADPRVTSVGYRDPEYDFMPTRAEIMQQVTDAGLDPDTAYITWMDAAFGALFSKLEEQGVADNTMIIFASDHGAYRFGKTTLYEGGMRVPLIVKWPNRIEGRSIHEGLVSNIDYVPTILDAAGVETPADYHMDGLSLMPVFEDPGKTDLRDSIFGEIGFSRGVKTKKWKYIAIRYPPEVQERIAAGDEFPNWRGPPMPVPYLTWNSHLGKHAAMLNPNYFHLDQLYDLENDPEETTNLFLENPQVASRMKHLLREYLITFENRPFGEFTMQAAEGGFYP